MKKYLFILMAFVLFVADSCADNEDPIVEPPPQKEVKVNGVKLPDHPRLLFTREDEVRVNELLKTEPLMLKLSNKLRSQANTILTASMVPFKKDERGTILNISREYVYRLLTLSLAHRLFGDEKYIDKINDILLYVCDFPEWGKDHFLDVSEMTTAVSIAYDWTFDYLPQQTKDRVKAVIHTRALSVAIQEYKNGNENSWAKRETNWNVVCNGGMTLGALAVAEDYPAVAEEVINNSVKYIPNCLKHFDPDGVCYEGPNYWGYTNIYLALFIKAMNDSFKTDYGISDLPGIEKTALFYVRTLSPDGRIFNFADSNGTSPDRSPCFFQFSSFFKQGEVAGWYREQVEMVLDNNWNTSGHFFLTIPWFDNTPPPADYQYPLVETYHGLNDIMVFRGNQQTEKPIWLIAKGAIPYEAHQQLDGGTFVVESENIRWAEDLGCDDYALPGFWDYKPEGKRWDYFRNTNQAHNTISIDSKLHFSNGTANIIEEELNGDNPFVTIDMSALFPGQAENVTRRYTMINDGTIQITDRLTPVSSGQQIAWSMVTRTTVITSGQFAELESNGKKFYLKIESPAQAEFSSRPAKNKSAGENSLEGVTILESLYNTTSTDQIIYKVKLSSSPLN